MDQTFLRQGIVFVWGVDKANRNLAKHEVSFETATEAFFDPFLRVVDASDQGEVRGR